MLPTGQEMIIRREINMMDFKKEKDRKVTEIIQSLFYPSL